MRLSCVIEIKRFNFFEKGVDNFAFNNYCFMAFLKMRFKFIWPGRSRRPEIQALEAFYDRRIKLFAESEIIVTRTARGMDEKNKEKIKEIEAAGFEKHLAGCYVICLDNLGVEMTSDELALFFQRLESSLNKPISFVVGGFLGLTEKVLAKADFKFSMSRMTFSHELCRVMLLEQVYRSLTIMKGQRYAK